MTYRISERAEEDIRGISIFIRSDESSAAARFLDRLQGNFDLLTSQPYIGRAREDLGEGVRTLPFASYVIFYRVADAVEIERVLHGAQNVGDIQHLN